MLLQMILLSVFIIGILLRQGLSVLMHLLPYSKLHAHVLLDFI